MIVVPGPCCHAFLIWWGQQSKAKILVSKMGSAWLASLEVHGGFEVQESQVLASGLPIPAFTTAWLCAIRGRVRIQDGSC